MAPPKNQVATSRRQPQQAGFISSAYKELRSSENSAIVKSVAIFALAVTFLQTGFGEFLVPAF
ncbi:hypothetical protein BZA77DRAFT_386955 [Pyronema omphalodes]|nr:hypothetical protein BZA77DRAFT_386955 [Pyronema omphalodes]